MKNDNSSTAKKTPEDDARERSGESLDRRYGQIGISAVAAAARYQGLAKNPAYAPAATHWHDHTGDPAA